MLLQDIESMSDKVLTLIRQLHARTHSRQAQCAMMKIALTFLVVINPSKGLGGVKVSIDQLAMLSMLA